LTAEDRHTATEIPNTEGSVQGRRALRHCQVGLPGVEVDFKLIIDLGPKEEVSIDRDFSYTWPVTRVVSRLPI
jgi:hypothetical protein